MREPQTGVLSIVVMNWIVLHQPDEAKAAYSAALDRDLPLKPGPDGVATVTLPRLEEGDVLILR